MQLLAAATVALCATLAAGFGSTPFQPGSSNFNQACSSLEPGHGFGIKNPSSNYKLVATRSGNSIKVEVVAAPGATPFKGFIVQADAPGSFNSGSHLIMNCPQGSTIRHSNPAGKTSAVGTFVPSGGGPVSFRGAVVVEYVDYYRLSPVSA